MTASSTSAHSSPLGSLLFLGFPDKMEEIPDVVQFVNEHDTTLNFPQKLMLMLTYVDSENRKGRTIDCISWTNNGQAFVIRDKKQLVKDILPLFSRGSGNKFSSFTRKLYRWGFRQICFPKKDENSSKDRDLYFGHVYFQRDNRALMSNLKSVTAAGTRRALSALKKGKKAKEGANVAVREAPPSEVHSMNTTSIPASSFTGGRVSPLNAPTSVLPPPPSKLQNRIVLTCCTQPLSPSRQASSIAPPSMSALDAQIQYLKAISQPAAALLSLNNGSFSVAPSSPAAAAPALIANLGDLENLLKCALNASVNNVPAIAGTSGTNGTGPASFSHLIS